MQNAVLNTQELLEIRNVDRLLPSQAVLCKKFEGGSSEFFEQLENLILSVQAHKSVEDKWDIVLKPGVSYASLGSDIGTLYFYQLLIRLGGIKSILELGTYIGVSALYMAEAAGEKGKVTTIEFGQEFYDIAKTNFERNGYSKRVDQVLGCGMEALRDFAKKNQKFDCILIDAAKESYAEMLELSLPCLTENGLILVDDVFFQGDVLNKVPSTDKGLGVRRMLEMAIQLKNFQKTILPIGNGLLIMRRES